MGRIYLLSACFSSFFLFFFHRYCWSSESKVDQNNQRAFAHYDFRCPVILDKNCHACSMLFANAFDLRRALLLIKNFENGVQYGFAVWSMTVFRFCCISVGRHSPDHALQLCPTDQIRGGKGDPYHSVM